MNGRLRTTLLVGLVGGGVLGSAGPAVAKQTTVSPTVTKQGPPPSSPTKPDEDEIVEVATPDSGKVSRSAPVDTTLQARLEQLEQHNADLTSKLADIERRLSIVANPPTAVRLTGYVDFGFFAFARGSGSGITNYVAQPGNLGRDAYYNNSYVQRFPEFFAPCGFTDAHDVIPCPRAPSTGSAPLGQNQARWFFLGDPLGTAINTVGHPADTRSQNNPGQTSQAVPYDYIQSDDKPTFIINELNLTPIVKLDALYYSGVTLMVGFWLAIGEVATPLAAWATFAAAYGALVIVEPLFSWLVLRTLARVKGHAAVRFCFDLRLA